MKSAVSLNHDNLRGLVVNIQSEGQSLEGHRALVCFLLMSMTQLSINLFTVYADHWLILGC